MNKKINFSLFCLILSVGVFLFSSCGNDPKHPDLTDRENYTQRPDTYKNFEKLSEKEIEGTDYKVSVYDRGVNSTILAIHGGNIDEGTSNIAKAVAKNDLNLYLFEGLKAPDEGIKLHITSHRFDEPRALKLVSHSKKCISIHGFRSEENVVCLGGNDKKLMLAIHDFLKSKNFDFKIQSFCKALEGTHAKNIVNKCADAGVQLEFSTVLRKKMITDPELLKKVSGTLREALFSVSIPKASSL